MRNEKHILDQLHAWAVHQDDVRAILLMGSRANPHAITDPFSDYDIELHVNDLSLFSDDAWLDVFGSVLIRWPLEPAETDGRITRLVIFEDGLRIDFQIFTTAALQWRLRDPESKKDYDNGYKILFDKDDLLKSLPDPSYTVFVT